MNKGKFPAALMISFFVSTAGAQQQGTSSLSLDANKAKEKKSPFHLTVDLSTSSNLYAEDAPEQEGSTDLDLIPSVELTPRLTLGARSIISQEKAAGEERDTTLSNTQINLSIKGPQWTKDISSGFLVRGVAPTNQKTKKEDSYQGAAALAASITLKKWITTTKYTLLGQRTFHEYNVNFENSPNVQYTLTHDLALDFQLTKSLSFSTSGFYKQGWTYRNFMRQTYGYSAGLAYEFFPSWSVGASVETEGKAFKPNGTDSNIKFYDQNTSVIKASVTFIN